MCSISSFRSYLWSTRYVGEVVEQVLAPGRVRHDVDRMDDPRPIRRCQMRLTIVRGNRPLSG